MAVRSNKTEPIGDESLANWELVGSGGFGRVYKAWHKDWGFDVAIKIPVTSACPPLHSSPIMPEEIAQYKEADHMEKVSCEFVLRVYGLYQGYVAAGQTQMRHGIVMEFMRRGSIQSLWNDLSGPPPWPLAFRLAHQVALGMNFLHSRNLMHHDLKPSNVLLNDDLNAKLADFGLSRVSTSVLMSNRETQRVCGGSYKYMPPEAFEASYEPVRAFDRYSYGILLWSIVNGKEPYPVANDHLVALRIPMGDRPPCEEIEQTKVAGLKELVHLMKRCWEENPIKRPTFKECLEVTENVFSKHKMGIHDAVHQVLTRLDSPTSNQTPAESTLKDVVDYVRFPKTEVSSVQVQNSLPVCCEEMSDTDKAKFVDDNRTELIQNVPEVMAVVDELGDMVHSQTYAVIKAKKTSQERMRELYNRTFRAGGVRVKAAFYDALKKHQPYLVERLGG